MAHARMHTLLRYGMYVAQLSWVNSIADNGVREMLTKLHSQVDNTYYANSRI